MTHQPHEALNKLVFYNQEELCQIYNNVNSFEWDERLGEKPEGFDDLPEFNWKWYHVFRKETKYKYIHPVCKAIRVIVGEKELLRYHHLHNLNHTNEEFERFWNTWQIEKAIGVVLQPIKIPNNIGGNNCSNNS